MIKILHCGDIHLDSPFSLSNVQKANARRALQRGMFTSLMLYVRTEKIDIMLMPGDIFDTDYVTKDTAALMVKEFESAPDCRFVIAPGNHDPYNESSPYARIKFPSNVYIFNSPSVAKFSFDDIQTDVYGFAFTCDAMTVNPFANVSPSDPDRINILCCHGDLTPNSRTCPITVSDIENSGFDYIALGHIHNSDGVHKASDTYYGYSGCPEGRGFDECGKKSVIIGRLSKTSGKFTGEFALKPSTKRRYEKLQVDISASEDTAQVISAVMQAVKENLYDADTSLRVILTGRVSPSLLISEKAVEQAITGLYYVEVKDKTSATYDTSALEADPTLKGAFYSLLKDKLNSENEEERATARNALRLGLSALYKM